mgnify:CR=1 FL=1
MSKKEHYLWIKREVGKVIFTEIFGIKSENQRITTLYKKKSDWSTPMDISFKARWKKIRMVSKPLKLSEEKKKRKNFFVIIEIALITFVYIEDYFQSLQTVPPPYFLHENKPFDIPGFSFFSLAELCQQSRGLTLGCHW